MNPISIWRKNNWRYDLRKYTREFEKKFKEVKKKNFTEAGKVYAIVYKTSSDFPTDKHHITPIIVSFGRFKDDLGQTYIRGLNLLFLKTHQSLEILENIYKVYSLKPDDRASKMIKLHEKYIRVYPYLFKNFEEKRLICHSEVSVEEWGMIPLLHKQLWGTFNSKALDEDFQIETKSLHKKERKKIKKIKEESTEDVEEYVLDDFNDDSQEVFVDLD